MTKRYFLFFFGSTANASGIPMPLHCYYIYVTEVPGQAIATAFSVTGGPLPGVASGDGFTVSSASGVLDALGKLRTELARQPSLAGLKQHTDLP